MKTLKKVLFNLLLVVLIFSPLMAFGDSTVVAVKIDNPLKGSDGSLMSLITALLNNVVMPVAAVGVVMWIVWAGFTFVTAQGKPAEIEKAKSRLLWSLIGAGILLGAAGISAVVEQTIRALINT